jgi:hypothetical protein
VRWLRRAGHPRCLATLLLGGDFQRDWRLHCQAEWLRYAEAHRYDLVVFEHPLDRSDRAAARSPSWQKCLVLEQPGVRDYERVVWIDGDVRINPVTAPDIAAGVPAEKVGGTNAYSVYSPAMHDHLYEAYIRLCAARGRPLSISRTGREYYRRFGIDTDLDEVLQCGVLVTAPAHHAAIFRQVYERYEQKVDPTTGYAFNLEMRPLSYELVRRDLHHFIDFRFNAIATNLVYLSAPHLFLHPERYPPELLALTLTSIYTHHWFLHFAGGADIRAWMGRLLPDIHRPEDFEGHAGLMALV